MAGATIKIQVVPVPTNEVVGFLHRVFTLYERGRIVGAPPDGSSGYSVRLSEGAWEEVFSFVYRGINETMLGAAQKVSEQVALIAYNEGVKAGSTPEKADNMAGSGIPAGALDTHAVLESIAENLRQMFDSGYEKGQKDRADGAPPRVVSARNTVQRDRNTGEIVSSLVSYQYEEQPGTSPPPL